MPSDNLPPITLRYEGLFDFDGLYAAVIDWCKNYGYKWVETSYKHKVPSPKGAEQELAWDMDMKVTEYVIYKIHIEIHTWDQLEVEVDVGGKKKPLSNARIYMIIKGTVEYDWQERFEGSKFAKTLGKWYNKFVFKKEYEGVLVDTLYYRIWNLHAILKTYFDMQSKKYSYKGYLGES